MPSSTTYPARDLQLLRTSLLRSTVPSNVRARRLCCHTRCSGAVLRRRRLYRPAFFLMSSLRCPSPDLSPHFNPIHHVLSSLLAFHHSSVPLLSHPLLFLLLPSPTLPALPNLPLLAVVLPLIFSVDACAPTRIAHISSMSCTFVLPALSHFGRICLHMATPLHRRIAPGGSQQIDAESVELDSPRFAPPCDFAPSPVQQTSRRQLPSPPDTGTSTILPHGTPDSSSSKHQRHHVHLSELRHWDILKFPSSLVQQGR